MPMCVSASLCLSVRVSVCLSLYVSGGGGKGVIQVYTWNLSREILNMGVVLKEGVAISVHLVVIFYGRFTIYRFTMQRIRASGEVCYISLHSLVVILAQHCSNAQVRCFGV